MPVLRAVKQVKPAAAERWCLVRRGAGQELRNYFLHECRAVKYGRKIRERRKIPPQPPGDHSYLFNQSIARHLQDLGHQSAAAHRIQFVFKGLEIEMANCLMAVEFALQGICNSFECWRESTILVGSLHVTDW